MPQDRYYTISLYRASKGNMVRTYYTNQASEVPSIGFQYRLSTSPYGIFFFIACLRYCEESIMRRRKNNRTNGRTNPSPKHTLHIPEELLSPYAAMTIRAITPAKTNPRSIEKSVARATRIPRFLRAYALSSLASAEPVPHTGYSPPAPARVSRSQHTMCCFDAYRILQHLVRRS